ESQEDSEGRPSRSASWPSRVLGFIGSAIIFWIVLRFLAPIIANAWGIVWIDRSWAKIGLSLVAALGTSELLARIEGTIWGRYYVIIGYLFAVALIVWIVLRLLGYV